MSTEVAVERTGNIFSIASTEYIVKFPNGDRCLIWSPPWHELDDAQEDEKALEFAKKMWLGGSYKPVDRAAARLKCMATIGSGDELEAFLLKHWPEK